MSDSPVPVDPVSIRLAPNEPAADEAVEMSDALAGRHTEHVHPHAAAEEESEEVHRALGGGELGEEARESFLVPLDEGIETRVQAAKGLVVRGQHQYLVADARF